MTDHIWADHVSALIMEFQNKCSTGEILIKCKINTNKSFFFKDRTYVHSKNKCFGSTNKNNARVLINLFELWQLIKLCSTLGGT